MLALKLANTLDTQDTGFNIYSLDFNGTDEYATANGAGSEIDPDEGTLSLWLQIDTTSSSGNIFKALVGSDNAFTLLYHAYTNELRFIRKGGGTALTVKLSDAIEGDGNGITL